METHLTPIESITKLYNLTPSQLTPVTGGHFSWVYEFSQGDQACILRITPPNSDLDLPGMRSILEWLAFLSSQGGPAPVPIRSENKKLIEVVQFQEKTYIAVAFEKSPGILAEGMSPEDWNDELFQALGQTVGKCHLLAQKYLPPVEFRRPEWFEGDSCFNPRTSLIHADPIILEKRSKVISLIQKLPKDQENYGLAHLDLHFGNFFIDTNTLEITLFDFDDCAYGWYIMDIAMLLFDVLVLYRGKNSQQFGKNFLVHLLNGYYTHMPKNVFWIRQLPAFLKLLEIGVYLMLYQDYDPSTSDEWVSKFMPGRKYRIENEIPYIDLDFPSIFQKTINLNDANPRKHN